MNLTPGTCAVSSTVVTVVYTDRARVVLLVRTTVVASRTGGVRNTRIKPRSTGMMLGAEGKCNKCRWGQERSWGLFLGEKRVMRDLGGGAWESERWLAGSWLCCTFACLLCQPFSFVLCVCALQVWDKMKARRQGETPDEIRV